MSNVRVCREHNLGEQECQNLAEELLNKLVDKFGGSFGLKEQIVFPEIDYDKVDALRGMDVTITTSAANNEEAEALLRGFNFPLKTK